MLDRCKIGTASDLQHDVRDIYMQRYTKFTADSYMWGSLTAVPITFPGIAGVL